MNAGRGGLHARQEDPGKARQKMMTLLIPVLAVTLVLLLRKPGQSPQSASASPTDTMMTVDDQSDGVQLDWVRPPLYRPRGEDPMRLAVPTYVVEEGLAPQVEVRETLTLRGILYSEDKPAAMIGTQLVHEGAHVSGVTVVKIERNAVVFERDGERWKQTVSAPSRPANPDTKENRTRPAGSQGNDDELS